MARVNTHDAAELVSFLINTPRGQRVERWPVLLSLLTQWAASGSANKALPARPWERSARQNATQRHPARGHDDKGGRLEQALDSVQQELHETANTTLEGISQQPVTTEGAAAAALSKLFAPATLVIAAAVDAGQASLDPQLRTLAVAAVCQATTALAAVPPAMLWAAIREQPQKGQQGLTGLLQSFKALVVACRDNRHEVTWLMACLLTALDTAIPNVVQDMQHKLQQQCTATLPGPPSTTALLQQQVQTVASSAVVAQLPELFSIGHAFGSGACKSVLALHTPTSSSNAMLTLQAVTSELEVACCDQGDIVLLGLAASIAAGVCVGVLEALVPLRDQLGVDPSASVQQNQLQSHDNLVAAAADVWGAVGDQHTAPATQQHSRSSTWMQAAQQQQQQQRGALRQQLVQQTRILTGAVQAACELGLTASTGVAAAQLDSTAAGVAAVGKGLLGLAFFRLCSACGHLQATQSTTQLPSEQVIQSQQHIGFPGLQCALHYLTDHCCQLSGLYVLAGCCHDAPAANVWLSTQQLQHPAHEVGALARWFATAAAAAVQHKQHAQLLTLMSAVKVSAVDFSEAFSMYQAVTPEPVASAISAALLRQQLDSVFAMHVVILTEVWQACKVHVIPKHHPGTFNSRSSSVPWHEATEVHLPDTPTVAAAMPDFVCPGTEDVLPELVAVSLADLAALQFCRVQLPMYVDLVRTLVTNLTASPAAADAFVAGVLPCYEQLIHSRRPPIDAGRAGEQASMDNSQVEEVRWLSDHFTVTRVTFLLPLLPLVVSNASSPAAAVQRVLPLLLLLLPHPVPGVSEAAHAAFAGLLAVAADPEQQSALCTNSDATQQQASMQRQPTLLDLMVQSVPMYLDRSLKDLPGHGSFEGLRTSFYSLLKNLPPGSTMGLLAAHKVAGRAQQLTAAARPAADSTCCKDVAPAHPHSSNENNRQSELDISAGAELTKGADTSSSDTGSAAAPQAAGISTAPQRDFKEAGAKLFDLLVLMIQLGDFQLLPTVLQTVEACVLASTEDAQQQWMAQLYTGCLASGDYTRKPDLMRWFNQLQATVRQQHSAKVADALTEQAPAASTGL